jgi:hypothetical protein
MSGARGESEPTRIDRVREKLRARRARKLERSQLGAELKRGRERKGEVGRYGQGDHGGFTNPM